MSPAGPLPGPLSARRKAAFFAVAIALTILLAFLVLEVVGRLFDPLGISYYPETARYMDTLILEEPIGYRNRPGLEGRFYHAPVRINALGMRDRDIGFEPAAGEFRIAVLGDSFPFGIGVPYEDSIPALLEGLLQEHAPAGRRITTLNFGVPSYNTEQELIQFDSLVSRMHPDAVVLLFCLNDIYPKMWVFEKRRGWVTNLAQRSYAVSLVFASIRLARASKADPTKIAGLEDYVEDNPRWLAIDRALTALNERCRARGIPFVVFPSDIRVPEPVRLVGSVGEREGFPVVRLSPWSDPRWSGLDPLQFVNSRVDSHPKPAGARIFAGIIAEELRRLGVVPPAPAAPAP